MKKKLLLLTSIFGLAGGLFLNSCTTNTNTNSDNSLLSSSSLMSLQAVTGMKLLSNASVATASTSSLVSTLAMTDEEISTLEQLLPQLDMILENDGAFSSTVESGSFPIGNSTYETKETYTFKDNNLENKSYVIYFNETASRTEEERDGWEVETTTYIRYDGVATLDGTTFYPFVSLYEEEIEGNESEEQRTFRINISDGTYVTVEQSVENEGNENEVEFEYKLVENYRTVLEYSIEIETDGYKDDIEYEINGTEYEISKLANSNIYVVKVKQNGRYDNEVARFEKVVDANGNTSFVYVA